MPALCALSGHATGQYHNRQWQQIGDNRRGTGGDTQLNGAGDGADVTANGEQPQQTLMDDITASQCAQSLPGKGQQHGRGENETPQCRKVNAALIGRIAVTDETGTPADDHGQQQGTSQQ
ncbi:hypothetical protein PS645_05396 [Pseudomonas fluorescens]|uniref:Uncharacterized protein n=1 Tax=Pseudomonas fluorescens TaxID=294 RepID=A0A5E6XGE6_PSEFL|nr:hypothetical protein PS645_05332 [Pseudomonas fluorescens]VVN40846.1 hypothetical protein PS645_05396 [Pseudomonas fluorescens]